MNRPRILDSVVLAISVFSTPLAAQLSHQPDAESVLAESYQGKSYSPYIVIPS